MKWSARLFKRYVEMRCWLQGVDVQFVDEPHILYDGIGIAGYFEESPLELAVAIGCPEEEWIEVLAHEFCHMLQWKSQCYAWTNCDMDGEDSSVLIDEWLNGRELEPSFIDDAIRRTIEVELDCEKRTVALIHKFHLPIDIDSYIQKANAYMYHYIVVRWLRAWNKPGHAPYKKKNIRNAMPTVFLSYPQYKDMSHQLYALFRRECQYGAS